MDTSYSVNKTTKALTLDINITTGKFAKVEINIGGEIQEVLAVDVEAIDAKLKEFKEKLKNWDNF